MQGICGVITKETDRAVYAVIVHATDCGACGDSQWLPKSQLRGLTIGQPFPNHRPDGTTEWRREFSAEIPNWLAMKVMPPRTGPIPYAQRPW